MKFFLFSQCPTLTHICFYVSQKYMELADRDKQRYIDELKLYQQSEAYQNFLKRKRALCGLLSSLLITDFSVFHSFITLIRTRITVIHKKPNVTEHNITNKNVRIQMNKLIYSNLTITALGLIELELKLLNIVIKQNQYKFMTTILSHQHSTI